MDPDKNSHPKKRKLSTCYVYGQDNTPSRDREQQQDYFDRDFIKGRCKERDSSFSNRKQEKWNVKNTSKSKSSNKESRIVTTITSTDDTNRTRKTKNNVSSHWSLFSCPVCRHEIRNPVKLPCCLSVLCRGCAFKVSYAN